MVISLFQQNISWLDPASNYCKIEQKLQELPDTDLLVMPEMCNTGFIAIPQPGQIEKAEEVEKRLLGLAHKYNTALCGSFAVEVDPNLNSNFNLNPEGDANRSVSNRNRAYFVTPEGDIYHYDKHHLFSPGLEDKGYLAGQERVMVEWRGIRFLLCICYDLRFPLWLRHNRQTPYDILLCVANWPAARQLAWDTLLRARAIENQAYCIGVNRVGHDLMCEYQGGTIAIHPYGHPVAQCTDSAEGICTFTPDMEKLMDFRRKFPSLQDAD